MSIQSNFPAIKPSLLLDFANTKQLDSRVTFTRSTPAVYYDGKTTAMAEQNLTLQSQTFNVSPWAVSNTTITANATTAPDGTNTADKIVEDTADSAHAVYQLIGTTSGSCTFSVYAKADTRSWLNINTYVAGVRNNWFDLTNGVTGTIASGCTATITSVGNGWYRCTVTTTGGSPTYFELWIATANNITTYAGNGTSGLFVWGAQVEAGEFATSYIATTSASATRTADVAQMTGTNFSSWFNNAQGTFVAIVGAGNVSASARVLKVSDSDANRLIDFYLISSPSQEIYSYQNGIVSANFSAGTISTSKYLTAVSYATGNISALVNGGSVTTSTSAVVSSVANSTLAIGYDPITNTNQLARPIAKIAYYPIQVTSAQLQALTS